MAIFTGTEARSTVLSGQPAIARVLEIKQPASGIHLNVAQVFTLKDGKAYGITYTTGLKIFELFASGTTDHKFISNNEINGQTNVPLKSKKSESVDCLESLAGYSSRCFAPRAG